MSSDTDLKFVSNRHGQKLNVYTVNFGLHHTNMYKKQSNFTGIYTFMPSTTFSEYIRAQIKKQELSISETANKTKISRQALHKILNGDIKQARLTTLIQLSHALNLHPLEFFRQYFERHEFSPHVAKHYSERPNKDDYIAFIEDVTYPGNSLVTANEVFTKIWKVKNIGDIPWTKRKVICIDDEMVVSTSVFGENHQCGLVPETRSIDLEDTQPGEFLEISINFTAPPYPATVVSHWKMVDEHNNFCYPGNNPLMCHVKVLSW